MPIALWFIGVGLASAVGGYFVSEAFDSAAAAAKQTGQTAESVGKGSADVGKAILYGGAAFALFKGIQEASK